MPRPLLKIGIGTRGLLTLQYLAYYFHVQRVQMGITCKVFPRFNHLYDRTTFVLFDAPLAIPYIYRFEASNSLTRFTDLATPATMPRPVIYLLEIFSFQRLCNVCRPIKSLFRIFCYSRGLNFQW